MCHTLPVFSLIPPYPRVVTQRVVLALSLFICPVSQS